MGTGTVNKYAYRVAWSEEDGEHVATCAEFPSLSHLDADALEALRGIRALVANVVAEMTRSDEKIPEPLSTRAFSGVFKVRIPSTLHRRLAVAAAESKVSLNRIVAMKLAQ
jgi:predicted RNase H-like HicB family nuclease